MPSYGPITLVSMALTTVGALALALMFAALSRHRLDLALLVDAEHDRRLRRVQVEPDDVTHLLDEQRGGGA